MPVGCVTTENNVSLGENHPQHMSMYPYSIVSGIILWGSSEQEYFG